MDRRILQTILRLRGQPVGLKTIAVTVGEEETTIEEVYEPYLIQLGYIEKTPRGRIADRRRRMREYGKDLPGARGGLFRKLTGAFMANTPAEWMRQAEYDIRDRPGDVRLRSLFLCGVHVSSLRREGAQSRIHGSLEATAAQTHNLAFLAKKLPLSFSAEQSRFSVEADPGQCGDALSRRDGLADCGISEVQRRRKFSSKLRRSFRWLKSELTKLQTS